MSFGKRLARLRHERGLTQQELADLTGISEPAIRRYEASDAQYPAMRVDALLRLSDTFGVAVDALLDRDQVRKPGLDEELQRLVEQVCALSTADKKVAKAVLEGLVVRGRVRG